MRSLGRVPPWTRGGSPQRVVSHSIGCPGSNPGLFERVHAILAPCSSQWDAHENSSLGRKTFEPYVLPKWQHVNLACKHLNVNEQRS